MYPAKDARLLDWVLGLGTELSARVDERATMFEARGLAMHADWHVWRLFWLLDLGRYDGDDLRTWQKGLDDDDDDERDVRGDALRAKLFGADHPYSAARLRAEDLKKIGTRDLERFRGQHYRARGATLIVTGGFDVDQMEAEIAELFGAWSGDAAPAQATVPPIEPAKGPSWIGIRDPDYSQPRLTIAFATPSQPGKDRAARMILREMLTDRARVVREGMGASYGVSIEYAGGIGGSLLRLDAALDPVKAGKAMTALLGEIALLRDRSADLAEDFVRARRRALATALADSAGAQDLAGELTAIVHDELPLDFFKKLVAAIAATTLEDVGALAARDLAEDRMVVVLSGRGEVIEAAFAAAGATAEMLDED
jgi:zinc protease